MLELQRGRIDHETRRYRHHLFHGLQVIGTQRVTRGYEVDDGIRQTDQRRQLHGTVQLDQIDVHTLGREVIAGDVDVFRCDTQTTAGPDSGGIVETFRHGDHHLATGDLQIQRLIQALTAVFDQHVFAGHAEIGGAILHVSRHVGRAHDDDTHLRVLRRQNQLA